MRDVEVTFSRKEFDLLLRPDLAAGEVVSRDDLMREVWNTTFYTSSKTIDVHLGWVRRKLGDDTRSPTLITTHRGKGLRFETGAPASPVRRTGPRTDGRSRPDRARDRARARPSRSSAAASWPG